MRRARAGALVFRLLSVRTSLRAYQSGDASSDLVLLSKDSQDPTISILTLNRPKKFNALTVEMGKQFHSHIQFLRNQPPSSLHCVVLTGAGTKAYSAGGDLDFILDRTRDTPANNSAIMNEFYSRFLCIRDLPVPVIAAVNGSAVGAGGCLAAACDLIIAAKDAQIGFNFVKLGIHPGLGITSTIFHRIKSPQHAQWLLLTGDSVTGEEAEKKFGFVLESLEREKVMERALQIARRISKNSSTAIRLLMQTLRSSTTPALEQALIREADAQSLSYASPDLLEGLAAVREKREPKFKS